MTCIEKLKIEHPDKVREDYTHGCPSAYGYLEDPDSVIDFCQNPGACVECWNREIPEPSLKHMEAELGLVPEEKEIDFNEPPKPEYVDMSDGPRILDSGNRREFESGAVRDIQEGKGRCDLLPLDVVSHIAERCECYRQADIFDSINAFIETNDIERLYKVLDLAAFMFEESGVFVTMLLEVSKHFEEGAKKYGDNNWRKGIPVRCYIDSAVRHYLKCLRGDNDEPHDRAFCWNIMCAIWTCKHHPELNEYAKDEEKDE